MLDFSSELWLYEGDTKLFRIIHKRNLNVLLKPLKVSSIIIWIFKNIFIILLLKARITLFSVAVTVYDVYYDSEIHEM